MTDRPITDGYPWFRLQKRDGEWIADGANCVRYGERLAGASLTEQGVTGGWSYENGALIVENDALGFLPIFFAHSGNDFIVAPSPLVIAALRGEAQLDPEAFAFFVKFGYFLGEDTLFSGIAGLAPGSRLEWRDGVIEKTNAHLVAPAPLNISRDEALDRYNALFAQAMRRRPPPPGADAVIPLSGGRDSRHIALEAARQWPDAVTGDAPRFRAITSSLWHSDDTQTPEMAAATQLAAHIGMAHQKVPAVRDVIANEARKNLLTGFCTDEASLISGLISQVPPPGCVYDGVGGDILTDGDFCQPVFNEHIKQRDKRALFELMFPYDDAVGASIWPLAKPFLSGDDKSLDDAYAFSRFEREFDRFLDFPNPAVAYFFYARTRREISLAPFMLWGAAGRTYAPFCDYDLVMYLLALPAEHFRDGSFHTHAIARHYPDAAHIPYGDASAAPSRVSQINMVAKVFAAGMNADPHGPVIGPKACLDFFTHYFRSGGRGANWRLLNLALQLVRLLRAGPEQARLAASDRFNFSHDTQFQPREAQRG